MARRHRTIHALARGAALLLLSVAVAAHAERVALTFDDLPLNGALPAGTTRSALTAEVVAVLAAQRVPPATGFVNGIQLEGNPDAAEALRRWVAAGHRVGNHTYGHVDLNARSAEDFLFDVRRNEPVLELLAPAGDWHWLRYPYLREGEDLAKHRAVRRALAARGYRVAEVTIDFEDYLWNSAYARCLDRGDAAGIRWLREKYLATAADYIDGARAAARVAFDRDIDHVLLLHLGAFSAPILPDLLALLAAKHLSLASLEAIDQDPVYRIDPDVGSRESGTLLEFVLQRLGRPLPPVPVKPYTELRTVCTG